MGVLLRQLRGIGFGEKSVRGTNVNAADGGAALDNTCGYPQMMEDWFINIACRWQVPSGPTEPIRSRNRDIFSGSLRTSSATSNGGAHSTKF
jgi:hypothetical protein